jgi:hypothetical protein
MEKNVEHQRRLEHPTDALAESREAMRDAPPSPPPSNHAGLAQGLLGNYAGRESTRPRLGDAMMPPIPRPEDR